MKLNILSSYLQSIPRSSILLLIVCFIYLIGYQFIPYTSYLHYKFTSLYSYNYSKNDSKLSKNIAPPARTLIIYVYGKTHELAEANLQYFIRTAVRQHHHADYYFILQQINNVPFNLTQLPSLPSNAHYIQHENKCFDLGTVGWFLSNNFTNITKYKYFIIINSSVRGPFIVSYYANETWYSIFTNRLNQVTKLVGPTINCERFPHVQSYLWALDFQGLNILLNASSVFTCHANMDGTITNGEIGASKILINAGFGIGAIMKKYQNIDFRLNANQRCNNGINPTFIGVDGLYLDPFEVVFVKIKDKLSQYEQNRHRVGVYEQWINTLN